MSLQETFLIIYNPEYQEYKVIHPKDKSGDSDYFTDNKDDAVQTAYAMGKEMGLPPAEVKIVHRRQKLED